MRDLPGKALFTQIQNLLHIALPDHSRPVFSYSNSATKEMNRSPSQIRAPGICISYIFRLDEKGEGSKINSISHCRSCLFHDKVQTQLNDLVKLF